MNDMDLKDHNIKPIIWKAEKEPKRMPSIFLAAERLQARLANKKKEKEPSKKDAAPEMNRTDGRRVVMTGDSENATEIPKSRKPVREGWISPEYSKSKAVKIDFRKAARNRCVGFFRDLPYVEHYKMLRTQIQQRCGEKGWKTIMVTSVNSEEGKTVTAINLSVVLAREFEQTVLLVDADLQKQHVHKYMGYQASCSLVDYLERDVSLSDVIVWPGIEKLTVISGDNTVRDSTEILGSPKMSSLVTEMKARYEKRYIVFDVPPVIGHADAMTFAPLMDGILLVVKPGRTDLKDIVKTMNMLPKEKIIGFAMNRYMQ
jgi:non-specific protein-tyrosine kinase